MEKEQGNQPLRVQESHFYYMIDEMSKQLTEQVKKDNKKAFILLAYEELENGYFSYPSGAAGLASSIAGLIILFLNENPELKEEFGHLVNKIYSITKQYENRKNKE